MPTDGDSLARRERALHDILLRLGSVSIALSGGLDSRFLCHVALRLGLPITALHLAGPHVPTRESAWAESWAKQAKLPLILLELNPLLDPNVAENGPERCYYCKSAIFGLLRAEVERRGGGALCDGSNASDLSSYRPGLRALRECGVFSPLAEAGLSKADIRTLAARTGLVWPEQTARPCLLTRFNYGVAPGLERLRALQAAEEAVERALSESSVPAPPFRLRFPSAASSVLHVQGDLDELTKTLLRDALKHAGFAETPVESVRSLSGYFDRQRGLTPS